MLLARLFCMPTDIDSVLSSETYYPFMEIYAYAVGSTKGATAMVSSHLVSFVNRNFMLIIPPVGNHDPGKH